jgi:type IV pilus assembly protein PilA
LVLVRPDLVVATTDLNALRAFNAASKTPNPEFASSAFGQRILQEYQSGVSLLAAADIQRILAQKPFGPDSNDRAFQQSGFADMKYAVWKRATSNGQSVSQAELSFTGPRHGAAAWLGKPAQLGSLDFVSPNAMFAFTLVLSNFAQIFDDIKGLAGPSQANTFAAIEGGQKALNLSLKNDLLAQLSGEFTVELDSISAQQPVAKVIFKVNDVAHLQKTLAVLLTAAQIPTEHFNDSGVAYDVIRVPNQGGAMPVAYTFVDGHWVIASKPETLLEAVQLHASGDSLVHSPKFQAVVPAGSGQPIKASSLFYQDPVATFGLQLRQLSPEVADFLAQFTKQAPVSVTRLYGEESAIRAASSSGSVDVGGVLVVAAIAIPNLIRSRMAANEASAVGSIRSMNTAQVTYATMFPKQGFAQNLAALGLDPAGANKFSATHAGLLDQNLANDACTGNAWCNKSGYQFRITTGCTKLAPCKEYVAVATPENTNTGTRSFCSTSDGVIHYKAGAPLTASLTVTQCRTWPPLR